MIFVLVILIVFSLLSLYFKGISPTVFGGDSGDIILSYFFAGVPHPPGYPLNTILGWFITRLPVGPTFAFRANFVSAVYVSLAGGLLFYLLFKLTKNKMAALSGALAFAFLPLVWLYAHVAEVFQLTLVLVSLSLIFLFKWFLSKERGNLNAYVSLAFFGLAVFHHQTTLLLAPAFLFFLYKNRKRLKSASDKIFAASSFFFGFVPYVFVPFAALRKTPINWDDPSNLKSFWQLITRADYGSFSASSDLIGFTLAQRLIQIYWYFKVVLADFTIIGAFLVVLGGVWLFIKERTYFYFFVLALFFTGPFFLFYASFPPTGSFLQGVSERFFLTNYLFLSIVLAFGILAFGKMLIAAGSRLPVRRETLGLLVWTSSLFLPFTFALINFPKTDLSGYKLGGDLGHDILVSADPPGLIFIQGDTIAFNSQYVYYTEKINSGSYLVLTGRLRHSSYRKQIMGEFRDISYPENFSAGEKMDVSKVVGDLLGENYGKVPIYSIYKAQLPEDFEWVPQGMLLRLYKKSETPNGAEITKKMDEVISKWSFGKDSYEGQYKQFAAEDILSAYAASYLQNGNELLKRERFDDAERYFVKALEIDDSEKLGLFGLGITYAETGKCGQARSMFMKILEVDSRYAYAYEGLAKVAEKCSKDEAKKLEYLKKAFELRTGQEGPQNKLEAL